MKRPFIVVVDTLCCLLIFFMLTVPTPKTPKRIDTLGLYAVVATWPNGSNDDVDLYLRDPAGTVCFFRAQSAGLMHLEQDDLGTGTTNTYTLPSGKVVRFTQNQERILVQGIVAGEYVVNVHMYEKRDRGPIPVTVQLWELRGENRVVITRVVTLSSAGQVDTPFRFTLTAGGDVSSTSTVPLDVVNAGNS